MNGTDIRPREVMERPSVERRSLTPPKTVRATSRGSLVPRAGLDVRIGEIRLFTSNALYVTTSPAATTLEGTESDMLSLHPPGVPRSPWSLHTESWDAFTDGGFDVGDHAVLVNGTLVVTSASGHVVVCDFADAPVWTSYTETAPTDTQAAKEALVGLLTLNRVALHHAQDRLVGRDEALVSALGNLGSVGNPESDAERAILVDVERLIGFGPGLTPSGDDLLASCLVSLLRWEESKPLGEALAAAVAARLDTPNATGFVSRQLLQFARLGYTHEAVDDLLSAIPLGMSATQQAAERLLLVGHASGADSLLGVVSALRVYCNLNEVAAP